MSDRTTSPRALTEAQLTRLLLAALALTTLAGLAVIVLPYIWDAAPDSCDAGSARLACSTLGGVLFWDIPLFGIPTLWLAGLAGMSLHRGRRTTWALVSVTGMVLLYLADYWIAVA
ncbi:hypothetical protein [Kitasatospora viridis]|uniref:Uncharacterized protein n=1 Tax=Kitasatospora viridis TaxID=281105 RepID=A0A561T732_9ACTN|nr:hypothetical protein [Kitasatospora viridis]TWF82909.1 hypothetical protein FHX73_14391 [Kitasatospora viridis]